MKEKFTLWQLLNREMLNNSEVKFNFTEKLKICSTTSISLLDRLNAEIEEYYIDEIPYRLLKKEVCCVDYYRNVIVVFK